jgi:hypothetical protein
MPGFAERRDDLPVVERKLPELEQEALSRRLGANENGQIPELDLRTVDLSEVPDLQ